MQKRTFLFVVVAYALCVLGAFWAKPVPAVATMDVRLVAADGGPVFGTLTTVRDGNTRIALLFHQAGANRHEYDPIAPILNEIGFDTLAIDQRAGGTGFGHPNETIAARGDSDSFLTAYEDLKGALTWAQARQYQTIISIGSSYSASLNILLARDYPQALTAIACFSPGEYIENEPDLIKEAAAQVTIPLYITTPSEEEPRVDEVLSLSHGDNVMRHRQQVGVHGASTLVQARNPRGYRSNLENFQAFLARLVGPLTLQ